MGAVDGIDYIDLKHETALLKFFFGTRGLGTSVPVPVKCLGSGQMIARSNGRQTASNLIYQPSMQLKLKAVKRALEFSSKSGFFAGLFGLFFSVYFFLTRSARKIFGLFFSYAKRKKKISRKSEVTQDQGPVPQVSGPEAKSPWSDIHDIKVIRLCNKFIYDDGL